MSDRIVEERARLFVFGRRPPAVSHYVYAHAPDVPRITRQFSNENGQVRLDFALAAVTMVWMVRGFMEKETV